MKSKWKKFLKFIILALMIIGIAACGSASSSSSGSSSGSGSSQGSSSSSSYSGSNQVLGTATASNADIRAIYETDVTSSGFGTMKVMSSEKIRLQQAALASVPKVYAGDDNAVIDEAGVYVFVQDEDCSLSYTGVSANVEDGSFTIPDLAGGHIYTLRVKKNGYDVNGNPLALIQDSVVLVPEGDDQDVQTYVSSSTGIVVSYFCENLVDSQEELDQEDFVVVMEAVLDTFQDLVNTGYVQSDSSLVDGEESEEFETILSLIESGGSSVSANTNYEVDSDLSALEFINQTDSVGSAAQQAEAKKCFKNGSSSMTFDKAVACMRDIMAEALGGTEVEMDSDGYDSQSSKGNSIPLFFLENFANAYLDGVTVTPTDAGSALNESMDSDALPILTTVVMTPENIADKYLDVLVSTDEGSLSVANLYADCDADVAASRNIATYGPMFTAAFPCSQSRRINLPSSEADQLEIELNVPQALLVFGKAGFFSDDETGQEMQDLIMSIIGDDGITDQQMSDLGEELSNLRDMYFEPLELVSALGFAEIDPNDIIFEDNFMSTVKTWTRTGTDSDEWGNTWDVWEEVDAILSFVRVFSLNGDSDINSIVLEYPKIDNGTLTTGTAEYQLREDDCHDCGDTAGVSSLQSLRTNQLQARLSTVRTASAGDSYSEEFTIEPWEYTDHNGNWVTPNLITDFETGVATIKVLDSDGNVLSSAEKTIIKPEFDDILWITPEGPDAADVKSGNWGSYEESEFDANLEDENGNSAARPVFEWSEVDESDIPDGTELGYKLMIVLELQKLRYDEPITALPEDIEWDWPSFWSDDEMDMVVDEDQIMRDGWAGSMIIDPWRNDMFLKTNSYKLPKGVFLPESGRNEEDNYETHYRAELRPVLRDRITKEILWEGNSYQTNFKVGLSEPWTVELAGTVKFRNNPFFSVPYVQDDPADGSWKIGLFKTHYFEDGTWFDPFNSNSQDPIEPVNDADGNPLVQSLSINSTTFTASYDLTDGTPISREDDILARQANYQLIVWYDQTEKGDWGAWNGIESTTDDAIDYFVYNILETTFWPINLDTYGSGIGVSYQDASTNRWEWRDLLFESDQSIDAVIDNWVDSRKAQEYEDKDFSDRFDGGTSDSQEGSSSQQQSEGGAIDVFMDSFEVTLYGYEAVDSSGYAALTSEIDELIDDLDGVTLPEFFEDFIDALESAMLSATDGTSLVAALIDDYAALTDGEDLAAIIDFDSSVSQAEMDFIEGLEDIIDDFEEIDEPTTSEVDDFISDLGTYLSGYSSVSGSPSTVFTEYMEDIALVLDEVGDFTTAEEWYEAFLDIIDGPFMLDEEA